VFLARATAWRHLAASSMTAMWRSAGLTGLVPQEVTGRECRDVILSPHARHVVRQKECEMGDAGV
jgi:hypothetical protein